MLEIIEEYVAGDPISWLPVPSGVGSVRQADGRGGATISYLLHQQKSHSLQDVIIER